MTSGVLKGRWKRLMFRSLRRPPLLRARVVAEICIRSSAIAEDGRPSTNPSIHQSS